MQQVRAHGKALRGAMKNVISIQSHVVYGAAGNSAAVFPMQRLGLNVWPIHTVQFSNHTQVGARPLTLTLTLTLNLNPSPNPNPPPNPNHAVRELDGPADTHRPDKRVG